LRSGYWSAKIFYASEKLSRIPRSLKIAICSITAAALLAVFFYWLFSRIRTDASHPDQTIQLSNSAFLRIRSTLPVGASDLQWELSYRDKSGWERVDDGVVEGQISWYGGNILACPVGKLVVVVRTDGSIVFVRTEAGQWKAFDMEISERAPFPLLRTNGTSLTSLETPAIERLRLQMFVGPSEGRIRPGLAQFLPDTRELWVDYLNRAEGRFRLRFMLTTDGEKLEFLDLQERPFKRAIDTGGPPFFIFLPDKSVPPACNKIEFFH
jgi:hypothetical protein